jgi:hypothetical protein
MPAQLRCALRWASRCPIGRRVLRDRRLGRVRGRIGHAGRGASRMCQRQLLVCAGLVFAARQRNRQILRAVNRPGPIVPIKFRPREQPRHPLLELDQTVMQGLLVSNQFPHLP